MSANRISPQPQAYEAGVSNEPSPKSTSIVKTTASSAASAQPQDSRADFIGKVMEAQTAASFNKLKLVFKFVNSSGSLPQNGQQVSGNSQSAANPSGSAQCASPVGNVAKADNSDALNKILGVIVSLIDLIKDLLMKQKPAEGGTTAGDGKPADGTNGTGQAGPIDGAPETNSRLNEMLIQLIKLLQNILPLIQEELEKSNQNGSANGQTADSIATKSN